MYVAELRNSDIRGAHKLLEALTGPTTAEVHHVEYIDGVPCIRIPVEWLEECDDEAGNAPK